MNAPLDAHVNSPWLHQSFDIDRLVADPGHVDAILIDGAERAQAIAQETMNAVKDIVGFIRKK